MSSALAAFVALMSLAMACVYWQEVKFQQSQTAVEEENHRAARESAYIGIATSLASAALRVFFILFGIQTVLNQSSVGSATALVPAIVLAVLVSEYERSRESETPAHPIDVLTIKDLLKKAIDSGEGKARYGQRFATVEHDMSSGAVSGDAFVKLVQRSA